MAKAISDEKIAIVFLPPYSQDFNPIESAWSKVKAVLQKLKARTVEVLLPAIAQALDSVTPDDINGWIIHCGYGL